MLNKRDDFSPISLLAAEMINLAKRDVKRDPQNTKEIQEQQGAEKWLAGKTRDPAITFEDCCDVLGRSKLTIRRWIYFGVD